MEGDHLPDKGARDPRASAVATQFKTLAIDEGRVRPGKPHRPARYVRTLARARTEPIAISLQKKCPFRFPWQSDDNDTKSLASEEAEPIQRWISRR